MLVPDQAMLIFATGHCREMLEDALGCTQQALIDDLIGQGIIPDTVPPLHALRAKARLHAVQLFAKAELLRIAGVRD